jgi:hypothetical protein
MATDVGKLSRKPPAYDPGTEIEKAEQRIGQAILVAVRHHDVLAEDLGGFPRVDDETMVLVGID